MHVRRRTCAPRNRCAPNPLLWTLRRSHHSLLGINPVLLAIPILIVGFTLTRTRAPATATRVRIVRRWCFCCSWPLPPGTVAVVGGAKAVAGGPEAVAGGALLPVVAAATLALFTAAPVAVPTSTSSLAATVAVAVAVAVPFAVAVVVPFTAATTFVVPAVSATSSVPVPAMRRLRQAQRSKKGSQHENQPTHAQRGRSGQCMHLLLVTQAATFMARTPKRTIRRRLLCARCTRCKLGLGNYLTTPPNDNCNGTIHRLSSFLCCSCSVHAITGNESSEQKFVWHHMLGVARVGGSIIPIRITRVNSLKTCPSGTTRTCLHAQECQ
jgi:hypothetical protein